MSRLVLNISILSHKGSWFEGIFCPIAKTGFFQWFSSFITIKNEQEQLVVLGTKWHTVLKATVSIESPTN